MSMNLTFPEISEQSFSVADFLEFGHRYAIDYHFPAADTDTAVVRGQVEEWQLASGLNVTHSDLQILRPYEAISAGHSPLFLLVVLEGCVDLRLNGRPLKLTAGTVLSTRLGKRGILHASHQKDQRLVTVSLGIDPARFPVDPSRITLPESWRKQTSPCAVWTMPDHIMISMRFAVSRQIPAITRELMLEGLMLQLLGLTLNQPVRNGTPRVPALPDGHYRLEAVRQLLESSPEQNHTLDSLAKTAAMSSSSLRTKFRQAYGESVFNYLRDCRLALARRYLLQGYSVQQAAWMSGYQHATNFSTAFRRRYGVAPSGLNNDLSFRA